ncbi:YcaO-like family protein [Kribbella sp. NPDC051770]|uniref:YcaO-like family protein n=1 Tax=Kribbella sp. NPDC051770 TaxID=3155413 RepID=UPI003445EE2A
MKAPDTAPPGYHGSQELFIRSAPVPDEPSIPAWADQERGPHKAVTLGTHRVVTADSTWQRAYQAFPVVGITRVADLTGLDEIGIPVWQAVRPNAATLSVSQGKGVTHELARVSAAMESIELWHAEQERAPDVVDSLANLRPALTYNVRRLHLAAGSLLTDGLRIPWIEGEDVLTRTRTVVPLEYVMLDDVPPDQLSAPLFVRSSNGLASGNTADEATLHGLLEILERDLTVAAGKSSLDYGRVNLDSIADVCSRALVDLLLSADVHLRVTDCGSDGIACFAASIWSADFPCVFDGFGCHFDRDVALARALTEAAQSRLTAVSGARDDLPGTVYRDVRLTSSSRRPPWPPESVRTGVRFADIATTCRSAIEDDVRAAAWLIAVRTGHSPIVVDLSRPEVGIPVVRVVGPGLSMGRSRAA